MKKKRGILGLSMVLVLVVLSVLVFATPAGAVTLPTVTTSAASGVGANAATFNGNVTSLGDRYCMFEGFRWGTTSGRYTSFWHSGSYWSQISTGAFLHAVTNLTAGTTYYYKAYVSYRWGTVYGAEQTFTTTAPSGVTVTTSAVADPTTTTALLGGNISATGGGRVWWRGFEWGTSTGVYTQSWTGKRSLGSYPTGAYTYNLTGLTTATTYYYRAAVCSLMSSRTTVSLAGTDDGAAEWSTGLKLPTSPYALDFFSVELYKDGSGNAGSTYLQFAPLTTVTFADLCAADGTPEWSFWHYTPAVAANWAQIEFRFTQPGGDADILLEVTGMPMQNYTGTAAWVKQNIAQATGGFLYYGNNANASAFSWDTAGGGGNALVTVAGLDTEVQGNTTCTLTDEQLAALVLTRVRVELWEVSPARTCYIDDVTICGVTYFIEGWVAGSMATTPRSCYAGLWGYGSEVNFTTD